MWNSYAATSSPPREGGRAVNARYVASASLQASILPIRGRGQPLGARPPLWTGLTHNGVLGLHKLSRVTGLPVKRPLRMPHFAFWPRILRS